MNWSHGPEELNDFLNHLNNIHPNIQFTLETESNGHLLFLDIDTYRRLDVSLGHTVYRKTTFTNLFLNTDSHHCPANEHSVLSTLVHPARLSATRKVSQENFTSSIVCSNTMAARTGRFSLPSVHLIENIHLERIQNWWSSCLLLVRPSSTSAGCCEDITSKL